MHSSSRTQRCIALSSAEAELYSSSGVLCDTFLLKRVMEFLLQLENLVVTLRMDSSSGRQVWVRTGVGRIRRLSCRVLWVQQAVASGEVIVRHIADINTKLLSQSRMKFLMYYLKVFNTLTNERVGLVEFQDHWHRVHSQQVISGTKRLEPTANTKSAKLALRALTMLALVGSGNAVAVLKHPMEFDAAHVAMGGVCNSVAWFCKHAYFFTMTCLVLVFTRGCFCFITQHCNVVVQATAHVSSACLLQLCEKDYFRTAASVMLLLTCSCQFSCRHS